MKGALSILELELKSAPNGKFKLIVCLFLEVVLSASPGTNSDRRTGRVVEFLNFPIPP